jgi:UDP-N-acetylglucosamine--N-acetylmuramyl-(pentapeptide) pyrophosphoryl-undecaprenol N-acetylglucosamine transferase
MMKKRIILTGGGSAGHVTPNIALANYLLKKGWEVFYIGSQTGIETKLIPPLNIPFFSITTGKLRRYFSWQNFFDPLKILIGIVQAYFLCRKIKPNIVFAKGGFVSFPVVVAAWLNKIPVVAHESDFTPGLANKLSLPFVNKLCLAFEESEKFFQDKKKLIYTGNPVREELLSGDANKGLELCHFSHDKKVILIIGGSSGAEIINTTIRKALPQLLPRFQIIHICGKGKIDNTLHDDDYCQFEYLQQELKDVFACADIIISRSGANSVYEILSLNKPHIFIPLATGASRGDQIDNAKYFQNKGFSQMILEKDLSVANLCEKIFWLEQNETQIIEKLNSFKKSASEQVIYDIMLSLINIK